MKRKRVDCKDYEKDFSNNVPFQVVRTINQIREQGWTSFSKNANQIKVFENNIRCMRCDDWLTIPTKHEPSNADMPIVFLMGLIAMNCHYIEPMERMLNDIIDALSIEECSRLFLHTCIIEEISSYEVILSCAVKTHHETSGYVNILLKLTQKVWEKSQRIIKKLWSIEGSGGSRGFRCWALFISEMLFAPKDGGVGLDSGNVQKSSDKWLDLLILVVGNGSETNRDPHFMVGQEDLLGMLFAFYMDHSEEPKVLEWIMDIDCAMGNKSVHFWLNSSKYPIKWMDTKVKNGNRHLLPLLNTIHQKCTYLKNQISAIHLNDLGPRKNQSESFDRVSPSMRFYDFFSSDSRDNRGSSAPSTSKVDPPVEIAQKNASESFDRVSSSKFYDLFPSVHPGSSGPSSSKVCPPQKLSSEHASFRPIVGDQDKIDRAILQCIHHLCGKGDLQTIQRPVRLKVKKLDRTKSL